MAMKEERLVDIIYCTRRVLHNCVQEHVKDLNEEEKSKYYNEVNEELVAEGGFKIDFQSEKKIREELKKLLEKE